MEVLEGTRRSIGLGLARFHFRKTKDRVIAFNKAFSSARTALLIMPLYRREFLPTVMVIDLLKRRFREEDITIISDDHGRDAVHMLPRSHFIHIIETEISPVFLPRPTLIRRIQERKYDLAIDLNLDFVLPSAYICRKSNAHVRIGFANRNIDAFYNFQIQPDLTRARKHLYDRLAQFLEKF